MSVAVVVFFALTSVPVALGHGYLGKPQARNFPAGDRNGYCPHCGNGQANVCGDGGQWPSKSNYLDFYNGPQATFVAGSSVEFEITVTAHHKGHFEFSICDEPISSSTAAPQECLNRRVLQRVAPEQSYSDCTPNDERGDCQPLDERHPERWYLPPPRSKNVHAMRFKVPVDLSCESCTLQWRYWTANSCVPKVDYKCYFDAIKAKVGTVRLGAVACVGDVEKHQCSAMVKSFAIVPTSRSSCLMEQAPRRHSGLGLRRRHRPPLLHPHPQQWVGLLLHPLLRPLP